MVKDTITEGDPLSFALPPPSRSGALTGGQEAGGAARSFFGQSSTTNRRGGWESFELGSKKKVKVTESRQTEALAGQHEDQLQEVTDSTARGRALPSNRSGARAQEPASACFKQASAVTGEATANYPAASWRDSRGGATSFTGSSSSATAWQGASGQGSREEHLCVPWKQWRMMVPKRKGKGAKRGKGK